MGDEQRPKSIAEALGDAGLAKLEAAGERLTLEAGTVLAEPGEPIDDLCLILSGAVEVFLVLDGGVERLVGTLRDRGLLGALAIAQAMDSSARCRTAEQTEIIKIPRDALHQVMARDAELALAVYPALVAQICAQARIAIEDLVTEIMPERNRTEFAKTGDTDFAYELAGCGRFRVNAFQQRKGPGCVLRHIPTKLLTLDELGLPDVVKELCTLPKGLVLVTGPTGSGKSTTLAAMVDHINKTRRDHIITIEDPIEFVHENQSCLVNQREILDHTESFAKALRAALREDPDIVLVGELRDLETTETAITTAETGHLVLGTLHTSTAASTVDRIIDQFPADRQAQVRAMLSTSLRGVIAQTLLKRADGKGRIAAFEILVMTPAVANHIREGKTYQIPSTIQTGAKLGMRLLNDDLIRLVKERLVAPEEAYLKAVEKQDMAVKLRTAGFNVG